MQTRHTTQGIIVKAVPYQDFHRIITLFTPDKGLVSLFVRGAFTAKKAGGGSSTPLSTVEVTYKEKVTGLHECEEIDTLDMRLDVRQNLQSLEAACAMLRAINQSQSHEKEAPLLYQLLNFYLGKLPQTPNPAVISSSFLLKTLRHEGLLTFTSICSSCQMPLESASIVEGEFLCRRHPSPSGLFLDPTEYTLAYVLALCDSYSQLAALDLPPSFQQKIEHLFQQLLH